MADLINFDERRLWNGRSEAVYGTPLQRCIQQLVTSGLGYEPVRDPHFEEEPQYHLMRMDLSAGKLSGREFVRLDNARSDGADVLLLDYRTTRDTPAYSDIALARRRACVF